MDPSSQHEPDYWFPFRIRWIRDGTWARLSKPSKIVFPVLASYADFTTGFCYPSLRTLQDKAKLSRTRVILGIKGLVKEGLIRHFPGNTTQSSRYQMVDWGGPETRPPWSHRETTPGLDSKPTLVAGRDHNYNQITINNLTTTTNQGSSKGRRGAEHRNEDLVKLLATELGLKSVGLRQLQELVQSHPPDSVRQACEEAVSQGKPSLKYVRGILRNWSRDGVPDRGSRREKAETRTKARAESSRKDRDDGFLKAQKREEAYALAQRRLGECPPEEITGLANEAGREADEAKIPGALRESYIQSRVLLRVAEKYGIQGI